jgi:DNA-directed RNA polymerase subunit K/omega
MLAIDALQEATEALLLAHSPTFKRLVDRALEEIEQGNTRPVEDLLNEL